MVAVSLKKKVLQLPASTRDKTGTKDSEQVSSTGRLKDSRLPREKTLETFDLARVPSVSKQLVTQLCDGTLIDRAENVLAFGNPGTGKTHLMCGIAQELIRNGRSVFFTHAYALVQHLVAAKRDLRLPQEIKRLDRFDAILIDDLGYVQQDRAEMDVLFTLFEIGRAHV